jgi:glycosyltransferase involved in cell wall biosynthesis
MSEALQVSQQTVLKVRKELARARLKANHLEDALETYSGILRDDPEDPESSLVIGDSYYASGDVASAEKIYSHALSLDSANPVILERLKLTQEDGTFRKETGETPDLTNRNTIARLLRQLTGREQPISQSELTRVAAILKEMVNSPYPAQVVARYLDEIDALLPALIELNIRQAVADGKPSLARALNHLLVNINLQLELKTGSEIVQAFSIDREASVHPHHPCLDSAQVLVLLTDAETDNPRHVLPSEYLKMSGFDTTTSLEISKDQLQQYDLVLAHNPHGNPQLLEGLAFCSASGVPLVIDIDQDFENLPVSHPAYDTLGLGKQIYAKAFSTALFLADLITVPSERLGSNLDALGFRTQVIPDGWSNSNPLWKKPPEKRQSIHIGWIGIEGQVDDVCLIRRTLIRILREYPHVQLVVGGDAKVYQLFDMLPESRLLFLPPATYEDFPFLLQQMDILIVPLRNSPFNMAKPDRDLVHAGASGIPWVASPIPSFASWGAGGVLAKNKEDWYQILRQLIIDPQLRQELGEAGHAHALRREMNTVIRLWREVLSEVIHFKGRPR